MIALILAGGLGTRLQAVIRDQPKPMAEVKGKPFLEYQVEQLRDQGYSEIVLCVGHLAHQIIDYFGDGHPWEVAISYAVETELLGTAGAIKNAGSFIEDTFLVLNGDSYLDLDFRKLAESHRRRRGADPLSVGTIASINIDDAEAYGTLEVDSDDRILSFREKAKVGSGCINGGVYVLEPAILDLIATGRPVSIEKEIFPLVLDQGLHLFAYTVDSFFVDIGTPEGYRRYQRHVEGVQRDHPE